MKNQFLFISLSLFLFISCDSSNCGFNIDKYEILAGDISKLSEASCTIDEVKSINLSIFKIDLEALASNSQYAGIDRYIEKRGYRKATQAISLEAQHLIPSDYRYALASNNLYIKNGSTSSKEWTMLLDKDSGVIVGQIKF